MTNSKLNNNSLLTSHKYVEKYHPMINDYYSLILVFYKNKEIIYFYLRFGRSERKSKGETFNKNSAEEKLHTCLHSYRRWTRKRNNLFFIYMCTLDKKKD